MSRVWGSVAVAALLATGLTACGSQSQSEPATLVVFAAASLKQPFTDIGEQFKAENPGTAVDFSFAGSSDLATQLTQGASADVFATADNQTMDKAAKAGLLAGDPVNFASNTEVIAVAPGNPKRRGIAVVVCAPPVPCGAATKRIEDATGTRLNPVSEESSVTDVLNKVTSGEADAGLVYLPDALGAGDKVTMVRIPEAAEAVNTYPIAVLKEAQQAELARRFGKP